LQEKSNF